MEDELRDQIEDAFKEDEEVQEIAEELSADKSTSEVEETESSEERPSEDEVSNADEKDLNEDRSEPVHAETSQAPYSWSADAKKAFESFPPEAQREIVRREKDRENYFHHRNQETSEAVRFANTMTQVLEPHLGRLQAAGANPLQLVEELLAADAAFRQDPAMALLHIAQSNGIDLNQLVSAQRNVPRADPQVEMLRQQISGLEQHLITQEQVAAHQVIESTKGEIVDFAEEKDKSGNYKHPYIVNAKDAFLSALQRIRNQNPSMPNRQVLERAYEEGVWATPEVRAQLLAAQSTDKNRIDERKRKAAQARLAGSSVTGSPGAKSLYKPPANDLRGALEQAFDQLA